MLCGIIAFQVLQQEPSNCRQVKAVLEKHAWYANQWQARLQDVPVADHALVLFMQAARWADDIRTKDRQHHRGPWKPKENKTRRTGSNGTTRGLQILVARLTARITTEFFYFATTLPQRNNYGKMNLATRKKRNGGFER